MPAGKTPTPPRLLSLVLWFCVALAEATAEPVLLPEGTGPVPDLRSGAKIGAIVTAADAEKYRLVLPDEVVALVVREDLSFETAIEDVVRQQSGVPSLQGVSVQPSGELVGFAGPLRAPLFVLNSPPLSGRDTREQGLQMLWNAAVAVAGPALVSEADRIVLFPTRDSDGRVVDIIRQRVSPSALGVETGTSKMFFREKIVLQSPSALNSLTWLSFRLFGPPEDYMWIASPLSGKVRQVTGSNRSDALFHGAPAPDDLSVWSGKVEQTQPLRVSRKAMLVPFSNSRLADGRAVTPSCWEVALGDGAVQLNRDSHRFPQHPGWIPTSVRWVPRWVWRVDFGSHDPFSNDVLQSVFIDEDTSMPVFKVVWGRHGELRKVVLGVLGFVGYEGQTVPWIVGQIVRNSQIGSYAALIAQDIRICSRPDGELTLESFDPVVLAEQLGRSSSVRQQKRDPGDHMEVSDDLAVREMLD